MTHPSVKTDWHQPNGPTHCTQQWADQGSGDSRVHEPHARCVRLHSSLCVTDMFRTHHHDHDQANGDKVSSLCFQKWISKRNLTCPTRRCSQSLWNQLGESKNTTHDHSWIKPMRLIIPLISRKAFNFEQQSAGAFLSRNIAWEAGSQTNNFPINFCELLLDRPNLLTYDRHDDKLASAHFHFSVKY